MESMIYSISLDLEASAYKRIVAYLTIDRACAALLHLCDLLRGEEVVHPCQQLAPGCLYQQSSWRTLLCPPDPKIVAGSLMATR